jgi:hypothetical protein
MAVKNTFVSGTDILVAPMNENFATLPWAMQVANGTITGTGTIALTAGGFHATTPPLATATVVSTANTATSVTLGIATYSGTTWTFPVYVWSGTTASAVARSVTITAFQQTSTTSLG